MKALHKRLQAEGFDVSTLRPLYESGDERSFVVSVSDDAEGVWQRLRELTEQTGFYPVILGDDDERDRVAESAERKTWGATRTLIEESLATSGQEFLAGAFDEFLSFRQEDLDRAREDGDQDEAAALEAQLAGDDPFRCMPRGDWPDGVGPSDGFSTPRHHRTGEHLPEVFIALVPTKIAWQVPIYLQFGGFNWCPHPDEIGAVLRYWHEKYGAEIACMKHDTLELNVERPPETRDEALTLAREQFLFCRDIVEQGTETIDALAAQLLDDTLWFFWWD